MSRAKKATISDVAKLAGVSKTTVSRALNEPHALAKPTLEKVRRAQVALAYAPSPAARQLRQGTANEVAFLVGDITQPFMGELTAALCDLTFERDLTVRINTIGCDVERLAASLNGLSADICLGAVIATAANIDCPPVRQAIQAATQRGLRIITTAQVLPGATAIAVHQDFAGNIARATSYLEDGGAQSIVLVVPETLNTSLTDAYERAFKADRERLGKPALVLHAGTAAGSEANTVAARLAEFQADAALFAYLPQALASYRTIENYGMVAMCVEHAAIADLVAPGLHCLRLDYADYANRIIQALADPTNVAEPTQSLLYQR